MLLMSPSEASLSIAAACSGSCPPEDDPVLGQILALLTAKVEASLNVNTLEYGEFTEVFYLPRMPRYRVDETRLITLRLCNGFLTTDPADLVITDPDGLEVDDTTYEDIDIRVGRSLGMVTLNDWIPGKYIVEYAAGFLPTELPDPEPAGFVADHRVLQGVPDWMKAIVANFVVLWYRSSVLTPKTPKDVSLEYIVNLLYRSIHGFVYGKYQRPRAACIWGESA